MFRAVAPLLFKIGGPPRRAHVTVESRLKFPV